MEVDSHKLMFHPERVAQWRETGDCFPVYVEIGPTNRCNCRCVFCALDWVKRGGRDVDAKVMNRALGEMASLGVKSVMFAGEGEPLLHPDIADFVTTAKSAGLDVSLTTNGITFDNKKAAEIMPRLSWVRFSVDAGTAGTYARVHGSSEKTFERVLRNIENAAKIKKTENLDTTVGVQMLMIPETVSEAELLGERAREAGADNVQIKPYSQHPRSVNRFTLNERDLEGLEEKLSALENDTFRVFYRKRSLERKSAGREYEECLGLSFFALVTSEADVIPCNLYYDDKEFVYGNLQKNSFEEIWKSKKRLDVIEKMRQTGTGECREICRLDPSNRYLWRLKNPHPHDNFI